MCHWIESLNRIHILILCIFYSFTQGFVPCAAVLLHPQLIPSHVPASIISSVSPRLVSSPYCIWFFLGRPFVFPLVPIQGFSLAVCFLAFYLHVQAILTVFSSVISHIFLATSIVAQIVSFRAFSSPGFLMDLLQKSISFGSSSVACCVFSVHVSASHNRLLRTEAW